MSSDNNSLWGKAVLFGLSVGIAGLFVVAGNSTYVQTNNGNSSSEVRASQQKDAQQVKKIRELEQAKREDGAKIKELKEQVQQLTTAVYLNTVPTGTVKQGRDQHYSDLRDAME